MKNRSFGLALVGWLALAASLRASPSIKVVEQQLPRSARQCTAERTAALAKAAAEIDKWAAELAWAPQPRDPAVLVDRVMQIVQARQRIERCVEEVLTLRTTFVELPAGQQRRELLRQYLRVTARLIDLSGRLRYVLRDAIDNASYLLSPYPAQLDRLIDLLFQQRVSIGAVVMSYALFDPPPSSGFQPFPVATKRKVLSLIAATRQVDLIPQLAEFLQQRQVPPELVVQAAAALVEVGLPQDPLPKQPAPEPPITAAQLHAILAGVPSSQLAPSVAEKRQTLLQWLADRQRYGIREDTWRYGNLQLQPGDWLLMRNPSPYNSFTDLAPGLFTHVGIVTVHTDAKGVRRFVIVDLPERGDHVPATTVDAYLPRTLNYFFLRHKDPAVRRRMGEVAASIIGNPTQFDLTFRTDRVLALKGKPLKGQLINTYCAGFLLLCAQETGAPREQFFPIPEYPAGGHCLENLAKLGISIGDHFVSPTGALFSPYLTLVGRREPMYSPEREIEEYIYDAFAQAMVEQELTPSPNAFQALREKLAELSKFNPWLARALARAGNVSEHMDLEAAAKAATVVETLDRIAAASREAFQHARQAFLTGPVEQLPQLGLKPEEIQRIQQYRLRHRQLYDRWIDGKLTPRNLRIELVHYYAEQGVRELYQRFFTSGQ